MGAIVLGGASADLGHGPLLLCLALDAGLPGGQMAAEVGAGHPGNPADPLMPKSARLSEMKSQRQGLTLPSE